MTSDLLRVIEELPAPDVLVVGDLILDRYVTGGVDRISPEAPIQVLQQGGQYDKPGGMAAVASNLARLGARVRTVGLVGDDEEGQGLRGLLGEAGIHVDGVLIDPRRPTTLKTRFIAASQHARQQILRVDREVVALPPDPLSRELLHEVREALPDVEILVLSDYGKGVLSGPLCREMIQAARAAGVKSIVDPKGTDFERYRGATAITPNRSEAGAYARRPIRSYDDAARAAAALVESLDLDAAFITLDRDGIYVLEREGRGAAIHTDAREVYDVTGAGDNVIAVLAYAMAGGAGAETAALLANIAGGIAVERFGVVTIGWDEIAGRIAARSGGTSKLVPPPMLDRLLESAREGRRKVVFTNGCFDILHRGHVEMLQRCRALGDLLVVGLNEDESVRRLKGEGRPVHDLDSRAAVLAGLAAVDYVVSFEEDTPEQVIRRVRPDVLVKGEDWREKGVVGREFVESYGGQVVLLPLLAGHSTTRTIGKMGGDA